MNKFIGLGNITKDLELKTVGSDKSVVSFTIAINESKDKVVYINCVAWDKLAVNLCKYQSKGSKVLVEGRVTTRSYQANDGGTKYVTEVVCYTIEYVGSSKGQPVAENKVFEEKYYNKQESKLSISNDELPF